MLQNNILKTIGSCSLLMIASFVQAQTQAKFTVTPVVPNGNIINISSSGDGSVIYKVTNTTDITRTLTTKPIPGVSVVTGGAGGCSNPFVLAPNQSCFLTLNVNGSQLPATSVHSGPEICKTMGQDNNSPSPFLCSQPSQVNSLNVNIGNSFVYLGSFNDPEIIRCSINSTTGTVGNCGLSGGDVGLNGRAIGITFNSSRSLVYAMNFNNPLSISSCTVNQQTGLLSGCNPTVLSITPSNPQNIELNPSGTRIYITAAASTLSSLNRIYSCVVDPNTGIVEDHCHIASQMDGIRPIDIVINAAGNMAYVSGDNYDGTSATISGVTSCPIDQTTGDLNCGNVSSIVTSASSAITLSADQSRLYTTTGGQIGRCSIPADGVITSCTTQSISGLGFGTGIAVNSAQTIAYVSIYQDPNTNVGEIEQCDLNPTTGAVLGCVPQAGIGTLPHDIILR